jgi:hypothetical protein
MPTVVHLGVCTLLTIFGVVVWINALEEGSGGLGHDMAAGMMVVFIAIPLIAIFGYGLFAGSCFALALHFISYRRYLLLCQLLPLPMALVLPHGPVLVYRLYGALGHPALKKEFDFPADGMFGTPAIHSGMAGEDQLHREGLEPRERRESDAF